MDSNVHCIQRRVYAPELPLRIRDRREMPVFMTDDMPRRAFVDRPKNQQHRSTAHFGQLKLFCSELWLLNRLAPARPDRLFIVYAGAAPGTHIRQLLVMFPQTVFHLYDPARFSPELVQYARANPARVQLHNKYFTDDVARRYAAEPELVFICDIRTGKEENFVQADMAMQEGWVRIMRPQVSLLKFRLPWVPPAVEAPYIPAYYLPGQVLLPVYAPRTSTECRLVVTLADIDAPPQAYDCAAYEQRCAYHNMVGRTELYENPHLDHTYDNCHDCAMFGALVDEYMAEGQVPTEGHGQDSGVHAAEVAPLFADIISCTNKNYGSYKYECGDSDEEEAAQPRIRGPPVMKVDPHRAARQQGLKVGSMEEAPTLTHVAPARRRPVQEVGRIMRGGMKTIVAVAPGIGLRAIERASALAELTKKMSLD